jgi:hypothetical protein
LPKPLYGRSGLAGFFAAFAESHPVCFFPRGRPDHCCKPYDTAFDRFAPVSPDRILGLHATPVPLSGTVLPDLSSGSCCDSQPSPFQARARLSPERCPTFLDFSIPIGILSTSRYLRATQASDSFGFITCHLLRSASYPCRLRAAAHPDRLPSSVRNPNRLSHPRVVLRKPRLTTFLAGPLGFTPGTLTALSSLTARLHGLCSRERPDCMGQVTVFSRS